MRARDQDDPTAPVIFLDRDGVINEHVWPAPRSWDTFRFVSGVPEALAEATAEGWRIVIVTNKGAVGAGLIRRTVSDDINRRMTEALVEHGVELAGVYACNHFPLGLCHCRKPKPGMLLDAKRDLGLAPDLCWMVGDNATDVAAGVRAGCRTVLLTSTKTRPELERRLRRLQVEPTAWAPDLPTAWRETIRPSRG